MLICCVHAVIGSSVERAEVLFLSGVIIICIGLKEAAHSHVWLIFEVLCPPSHSKLEQTMSEQLADLLVWTIFHYQRSITLCKNHAWGCVCQMEKSLHHQDTSTVRAAVLKTVY